MAPPPIQPPPRTPAPSRFLHSKRQSAAQTHPSQNHTPPIIQPQPQPQASGGGHQFQATPRFSSAASAPRLSLASTPSVPPLKPRAPRAAQKPAQELVILDSSPVSAEQSPCASPVDRLALPEPIEFASSSVTQSPSREIFRDHDHDTHTSRASKRRRISITSSSDVDHDMVPSSSQLMKDGDIDIAEAASSLVSDASRLDDDDEEADNIHDDHDKNLPTAKLPPSSSDHHPSPPPPPEAQEADHHHNDDDDDDEDEKPPTQKQTHPTFSAPPRFKPPPHAKDAPPQPARRPRFKSPAHPTDPHLHPAPPPDSHLLPDIFSPPRRRGAKYTSGGLAAELRDWLVEIKETSEATGGGDRRTSATAASVYLRIGQVRHGGPGMTLISGQPVGSGGIPSGPAAVRAILAGEGSVEDGFGGGAAGSISKGRGNRVAPGAVVAVAPPAWDVDLDGTWAVAYRWEVMKGDELGGGAG
ncbi:hypothetical protein B0T22DRAFT_466497 [Podospora appendiculata]|uniref:Uncharacterized protein n=1 Tax=Podospora appendiculata TaxID=314037 RepID=A0AAE1CAR1_9PEZI|nr:hypothetical protein B0T22DRAFT_466497 [Podospora appendiculata]